MNDSPAPASLGEGSARGVLVKSSMAGTALRVEAVSHRFDGLEVLKDLSLDVADREFLAVVGPSGCGKTTLLNLLSGFYHPSSGRIVGNGKTRTVYQQDGLFPWLTVAQNISMALRHLPRAECQEQLKDLIALIHLDGFADHYPHQLSGGMKQRVELARALSGESDIILMDEPFSSLDFQTRLRMRMELLRLLRERPRTVVFVTHDIEEAAQLADRVVVLSARPGRICYTLPLNIAHPRSPTHPEVVDAERVILEQLGFKEEGFILSPNGIERIGA